MGNKCPKDAYHFVAYCEAIGDYMYAEDGCQCSVYLLQFDLVERKFPCMLY